MPLIVDASVVVAWFARNQASDYTDQSHFPRHACLGRIEARRR